MTLLIGIDEAGYGPNLGPLVVAATVWEVGSKSDSGMREAEVSAEQLDLYQWLAESVSRQPSAGRIAIDDSKRLYQAGSGLERLEWAIHAALVASGQAGASWSALLETLRADPQGRRYELPWQHAFDCALPVDATVDETRRLGKRLDHTCRAARAGPMMLRGRLVFPRQFNDLIALYDSKGAALSHTTLALLRELLTEVVSSQHGSLFRGPTIIVCDKHGGRNRYGPLLATHFPADPIEVIEEGRAKSRYRWETPQCPVEICIRTRGEEFLPTALASMTAKYLRELAMGCLNRFWQARVPGIRPTAGYPLDAKRFRTEIRMVQQRLGIPDHDLWRNR